MPRTTTQELRSSVSRQRPQSNLYPVGSRFVNLADRQTGYIDATQVPVDLVAVRYFVETAAYVVDEYVIHDGTLWVAARDNGPGSFDAADWRREWTKTSVSAVPPTQNVVEGDIWINSSTEKAHFFVNSRWIEYCCPTSGTQPFKINNSEVYPADGTDTFAINYDLGLEFIWLNGSLLHSDGYTATDGNTIVLDAPVSGSNNIVRLTGFQVIETASMTVEKEEWENQAGNAKFFMDYSPGWLFPFLNGSNLANAEFTATDGSEFDLSHPMATANDVLAALAIKQTGAVDTAVSTREWTNAGGQSTFSIAYLPSALWVWLNGSLLSFSDYTAADGSTITLTHPVASAQDTLRVLSIYEVTAGP